MLFLITDTLLIFDHRFRRLRVLVNVFTEGRDPGAAYDEARAKGGATRPPPARAEPPAARRGLRGTAARPSRPPATPRAPSTRRPSSAAKEYIRAGDIFQFVPSQRFETPYTGDALSLYRALRFVNPSPYMFLLQFGNRFSLVGSSPEVHVRALDGCVEIRPIAGTRRRGATADGGPRSSPSACWPIRRNAPST